MTDSGHKDQPAPAPALRCVIQPGWRRIDYLGLLTVLEHRARQRGVDARPLREAEDIAARDGLVILALRLRSKGEIVDVLTVALPLEPAWDGPVSLRRAPSAQSPELEVPGGRLQLVTGPAVVHDVSGVVGAGRMTVVELVTQIPPAQRGAVVTVLSTQIGSASRLQGDAIEMAESLRLVDQTRSGILGPSV